MLLLLLSRFSCVQLCDPIDGSPPGSALPGILQTRTLEWLAISFSKVWKWTHSVVSDSSRPHGLQPTKLLRPWDFPGKSTALLTIPKLLIVWTTTNSGKFLKRWEYQTTCSASWEICMQVNKQHFFLWLSNILLYIWTTCSLFIPWWARFYFLCWLKKLFILPFASPQ